jgi:hypothetical protein
MEVKSFELIPREVHLKIAREKEVSLSHDHRLNIPLSTHVGAKPINRFILIIFNENISPKSYSFFHIEST